LKTKKLKNMSKLISQLPEDIKAVALQRKVNNCDILNGAFTWVDTPEKYEIWQEVNNGNYTPFRKFHAKQKQSENNGWISVEDRLPDENKDGNKVLLYRIMNDTQETMPITVHDSKMVKHCIPQETWWQPLPPPPPTKN
jgi:hypothetical protein